MRRFLSWGATLACAGLLLTAGPAQAHSALVSASPGPGDQVPAGTTLVTLTFTSLDAGASHEITVTGPAEEAIPTDEPVADETNLCTTVEPLAAGVHAVAYVATSGDGDPITGRYYFEVVPAAGSPPAARQCPAAGGGLPVIAVVAGLALLVAGAAGWLVIRRRRRAGEPPPET